METNNLISTPNIEGNIGQCKTTVDWLNCAERTNLWTCQDVGYATNSCTGKVDQYHSWEFTATFYFTVVTVVVVLVIALFSAMNKYSY